MSWNMIFLKRRRKRVVIVVVVVIVFTCLMTIYKGLESLNERKYRQQDDNLRRRKAGQRPNVIVGHYIGAGTLFGNASNDINENHFNPVPGEGEYGSPVSVPSRDVLKMQHVFQVNRFNLMASDRVSLNRSLPDVRRPQCQSRVYDSEALPTTSVVIVFHNEAWSVLLRTVWSVITRSPRKLVKEILLVDDASDRKYLLESLDNDVAKMPIPTRILRLKERSGLVAARLLGAEASTGDTLTFLDAHCECSTGWLEPLLERIRLDRRKVACPVIDIISDDNFSYIKSFELHWGAFNWRLHFRWLALEQSELLKRQDDISVPFSTPTMAGGLFTIDRSYFFEIGSYDKEMKIWGGDNLEMSFRIWQCGGEVEIVPCSHVGHLFRKSSPYTFPGGVNQVLNKNLARTALVWMDEWAEFFFKFNVDAQPLREAEDVLERVHLRKELKCRSFKWYLNAIWPQHFFPAEDRFFGKILLSESALIRRNYQKLLKKRGIYDWKSLIRSSNDHLNDFQSVMEGNEAEHNRQWCINRPIQAGVQQNQQGHGQATVRKCEHSSSNLLQQMFVVTDDGKVMTDENLCLDAAEMVAEGKQEVMVRFSTCAQTSRQEWRVDFKKLQIVQKSSGRCVQLKEGVATDELLLVTGQCPGKSGVDSAWMFISYPWK